MEHEVINLANQQVQSAISNALNSFTPIASSVFPNRSVRPSVSLRSRSSSYNRNNHRKVPFHKTIPRYSIPATKNDLIHYKSRSLTHQTHSQTSQNINTNATNRSFDIQYSFSLHQPWLTELIKQQQELISIQNFVDEFIEQSIQTALLQVCLIDNQNLTNDHTIPGEDETVDDGCPSSAYIESLQTINSYAVGFIHSTIQQAIEDVSSREVKLFSNRLAEEIMADVLSTIAYDEIYFLKIKKKSIQLENIEQQQINLFNQIPYYSSPIFRLLTNNSSSNEESIDFLVNNIAQKIYINSFDELRQIFTKDNDIKD